MPKREWISDLEVERRAVKVCELLHGVPMGQAKAVLDMAAGLLADGHVVDVNSPRFSALREEFLDPSRG